MRQGLRQWIRMGSVAALTLLLAACGAKRREPAVPGAGETPAGPMAPGGGAYIAAGADGSPAERPQMNPQAAQAYAAGMQAFQHGDLEGARTQFERATQLDPQAFQAFYSLGVVQERLGQDGAASTSYRKSFGIAKDYAPAIVAQGLLLARTGKEAEAESFLNDQRARLPDSAAVLAALAEVKSIRKDSAEAQRLAREALKKDPDYRPAMMTLARDHYRNRRLDLALYTLKAILDGYGAENPPRDKNNGGAWLLRGLIYREQGRRRDAIAQFEKAVELRPDLVEARLNLAKYMLEAGNASQAVPILEGALRYDASNVLVHLNLGDAYRLMGRPEDATKHFEWVVSQDSSVAEAHYNLGLLYLFSQNIPGMTQQQAVEKAIAELERYKEMRRRARAGAGDDVEELLGRAKNRKAVLEAMAQQEAQPPPPPMDDGDMGAGGDASGTLPPVE